MANTTSRPTTTQAPTMRRRGPGVDFLPGAGYEQDDTIAATITDVQDRCVDIDDAQFGGKVRPAIMAAANACMRLHDYIWDLRDQHTKALIASRDIIVQNARQTRDNVPTSGWGSPADLQAAQARAGVDAEVRSAITTRDSVLAKAGSGPQDVANAFGETLKNAADEVAFARTRWLGPGAFRGAGVSLADVQLAQATEEQIRSADRPMAWALDFLAQAVNKADPDELQRFIAAARAIAIEVRSTPAPKLAARWPSQGNRIAELEQEGAFTLLYQLDQLRAQTAPRSVTVGAQLVGELAAVGSQLAGVSLDAMTAAAFASRFLEGNTKAEALFEAEKNWPVRWLKPRNAAGELPGWSEPMAMSSLGGIVRLPKAYR